MKCVIFFLIFFILNCSLVSAESEKKVVCYHGTWSTYRNGRGNFGVVDINPYLCTHLIYAFVGVDDNTATIQVLDEYLDLEENWGRGNIKQFNELKTLNSNLKTLIGIGGWNQGSAKYSAIASNPEKRKNFAADAVQFVLKHGFDGIDFDWEYPAQRDGDPTYDKENFILLLEALRTELNSVNPKLLLTSAVAAAEYSAVMSYNIPRMAQLLDFINIMTYDFRGAWDVRTGLNAGLYATSKDESNSDLDKTLNVDSAIQYWLSQGVPKEKLILGIPFYARTFQLADTDRHEIGSPINGPGLSGPYTAERGYMGFNELCELFEIYKREWTIVRDAEALVPYAYSGQNWISYDDLESVNAKIQYALVHDLGGVMAWSIETDDFLGNCGHGANPLLSEMAALMKIPIISTTQKPTTSTTETVCTESTTVDPDDNLPCEEYGMYRHPKNCAKFYTCNENGVFIFSCPSGLLFDELILSCNWPDNVIC